MNEVQEIYLKLLRAALGLNNGERLTVNGECLSEVIRLAAFQGTGPLVYDQLLKLKDVDISADLRMQMKQQCLQSMMLQQSMAKLLIQAWKALEKAEIQPVLLKGFGLAQYYPQPHLRQWGDMDIYVGKVNYHKACGVLRDTFPGVKHMAEEGDDYKHYNFEFGHTVLELHRVSMTFAHPRDRRYYEFLDECYLTKEGPSFEIDGELITTPEETFNIFFVFLHAWHHFIETGMNMKQLSDIAILLHTHKGDIDIERLHEMITRLYLMEAWQQVMWIMVHHLGVPQEECPYYTKKCSKQAERLFEQILIEGSSYRKEEVNAEGAFYLRRKWLTYQLRLDDSRRVRPYAPRYARHMVVADFLHGVERVLAGK